jgi:hypothetical protein
VLTNERPVGPSALLTTLKFFAMPSQDTETVSDDLPLTRRSFARAL